MEEKTRETNLQWLNLGEDTSIFPEFCQNFPEFSP